MYDLPDKLRERCLEHYFHEEYISPVMSGHSCRHQASIEKLDGNIGEHETPHQ